MLFNVGMHGGALPGLLAIEQSVTGMVVGGTVKDTGVGTFYLVFDAAVAAILAAQGWSLARLARRRGGLELPPPDFSRALAQGRRWALPLLWEFGVPAAIAIPPQAMFKVNWKAMSLLRSGHQLRTHRGSRPCRTHRTPAGGQGPGTSLPGQPLRCQMPGTPRHT